MTDIETINSRLDALRSRFGEQVEAPVTGKVWVGDLDVTALVERPSADLDTDELVERVERMIEDRQQDLDA